MAISETDTVYESVGMNVEVRNLTIDDLKDALRKGISDFREKPTFAFMVVALYPIVALLMVRAAFGYALFPFLFPLTAGFALIGPIAATGLYEISRKLEKGEDIKLRNMFKGISSGSFTSLLVMAAILLAVFVSWQWTAINLYILLFDEQISASFPAFVEQVTASEAGLSLFLIGNFLGFIFAALVLVISVVSIPMILHREVGAFDAIIASTRVALANKKIIAIWGLIVASGLVVGIVPFFFGLAATFPILGHATWHLYRKAIA